MLSPHEFATLMLIRHAPDQLDTTRAEIDALLERQLIMLEHRADGHRRVHLTPRGRTLLDVFGSGGRGRAPADTRQRSCDSNDAQTAPPSLVAAAADAMQGAQPQT
ncbi:hypothetical protein WT27_11635 [Burkholderia territorii]|uniref:Preprotein translocase subunit SecA n=1 Tax=Burkholderia territorii TaxID=1503055 RepID=A0A105V6T2_9BURK|nr:hypothetical protein [Burkholderia territorii]KVV42236.1 hypothetical protein WT27_11635 [Burkholderia territorii]KVX41156.1 hypothetical protein WT31_30580 [Burkholderia territorii]